MKVVEARKKHQEARKFSKEVAAERTKQRAAEKRATLDAVKQFKKHRKEQGGVTEAKDDDRLLEGMLKSTKAPEGKFPPKKSRRRQGKDEKYGFGGKKRGSKKNTADSSASMEGFSSRNISKSFGGKGAKSGKGASRPGKDRRQQKRQKH